jgi:hypothetical protein
MVWHAPGSLRARILFTAHTAMFSAPHTRCLRLLALCLLMLCAPVLDAADCCCRPQPNPSGNARSAPDNCCAPKNTPQHPTATCCQSTPATHRHSSSSRSLPAPESCECCLNTASLVAGHRPTSGLGSSPADADLPDAAIAAPATDSPTANTISQLTKSTPPAGNRRQAVLCCWRN